MYAGHVVEAGPTETVLADPKHPHTQLLLSAVADPRDTDESVSADTGEPPRVINPSEGCRFRWRCPYAFARCAEVTPRPLPVGATQVACHLVTGDAPEAPKSAEAASRTQ